MSLDTSKKNNLSKKKESSNKNAKSKEIADGCIRSPGPDVDNFTAVKSFLDFKIPIGDGLLVLPDHVRWTYYHLCQARKAFLHKNLLKITRPEITSRLIVETAKIAEGIRASSPTSLEDLAGWKKTLESFESMGMDVAFMCDRIDDLLSLLHAPSSTSVVPEGYEKVKLEQSHAVKKLRDLESMVLILKDDVKEMDVKMEEMLEVSSKKKDQAARKLATAPW